MITSLLGGSGGRPGFQGRAAQAAVIPGSYFHLLGPRGLRFLCPARGLVLGG